MAIADNYAPVKYTGNGVTVNFSFSFAILNQEYVRVIVETIATGAQEVKTLGVDYTVSFNQSGGVVTMTSAPTSAQYLIVAREVAINQDKPYTTSIGFNGSEVEKSFDKITAVAQDLRDFDKRCIAFPEGSTFEGVTLPASKSEGKALQWDSGGNLKNTEYNPDEMVTLATAQAAAAAVSASNASSSAATANNWAVKTDAAVSGGEFSAKAHAIGATGLTTGSAKDWATKAEDIAVVTGQYSALHWAAKSEGFANDAETAKLAAQGFAESINPANLAAKDMSNVTAGSVTETLINAGAVTSAKIADANVTSAKLANDVVSGATAVTAASNDYVFIADTSDTGKKKKALISDIVAMVTAWPGVYTGTSSTNASFPVGTQVAFRSEGDSSENTARNSTVNIYTHETYAGWYDNNNTGGTQLSGTWNRRGATGTTASDMVLAQRTA